MSNEITLESLATIVGAVPATALILQFVKVFWKPSNATLRQLAAGIAALLVVAATWIINDEHSIEIMVAAVFAGLTAGLAASQTYEVAVDGLNHTTTITQPTKPINPPDHPDA